MQHPSARKVNSCNKLLSSADFVLADSHNDALNAADSHLRRVKVVQKLLVRPLSHPASASRDSGVLATPPYPSSTSSASPTSDAFVKRISFVDSNSNSTAISWPRLRADVDESLFEDSGAVTQLARSMIRYLNELGFTDSTLISPDTRLGSSDATATVEDAKKVLCEVTFNVRKNSKPYTVKLKLVYEVKIRAGSPQVFISHEQLSNYLRDKLVFRRPTSFSSEEYEEFEQKMKTMELKELKCYVDGLLVEI